MYLRWTQTIIFNNRRSSIATYIACYPETMSNPEAILMSFWKFCYIPFSVII